MRSPLFSPSYDRPYLPLSAIAPELSADRTLASILEESGVCSSLK
ncbi:MULTISPECIES: hypothetical protein [unclassified Microcoleus]